MSVSDLAVSCNQQTHNAGMLASIWMNLTLKLLKVLKVMVVTTEQRRSVGTHEHVQAMSEGHGLLLI